MVFGAVAMYPVDQLPAVSDEFQVLEALVPLHDLRVIELGCGAAKLARDLVLRQPGCHVVGLEVDAVQHAKNLAAPQDGLEFVRAGAEAVPCPDASFDLALMLKSLHHVPIPSMARALGEVARILKPGGHFYVSEPIYDGALNAVVKLYNDEGVVRAAAQAALDEALAGTDYWMLCAERRFAVPVSFKSFDAFEARMMRPTYADHHLDAAKIARVRDAFEEHGRAQGGHFVRPMLVRVLRRTSQPCARQW